MTDEISQEYRLLQKQLSSLLDGENHPITNFSQISALIFNQLEDVNWAGVYLLSSSDELQLGPFQGQVACTKIKVGQGVCGTAAEKRQSVVVADVDLFKGHIACDSRSRSEIVVPLVVAGKMFGVFDVDSPILNRFNQSDRVGIEGMIKILIDQTDFELMPKF